MRVPNKLKRLRLNQTKIGGMGNGCSPILRFLTSILPNDGRRGQRGAY